MPSVMGLLEERGRAARRHRVDHLPVAVALRLPAAALQPAGDWHRVAHDCPLRVAHVGRISRPPVRPITGVPEPVSEAITRQGDRVGRQRRRRGRLRHQGCRRTESDPQSRIFLRLHPSGHVGLALDISDVSSFASFTSERSEQLERWGASRLDILVNNAGVGIFGPLGDDTIDGFDTVMGTNVRGAFFVIQSLVPLLPQGGRVINVSTSLSRHTSPATQSRHTSPATSVYSASKAAVEALSRTLAAELGPRGIRVNSIAPGPTATDFNGGAMRDDAEMRQVLAGQTALDRVGEPEEIGDAIATLASEGLRWVTAQRIEVSGGALL